MNSPVRVRFAPSPTGMLHIGSMRSGLFNYLWARHNDGVFVLRLEDTDRARFVEGAEEQIDASFAALGIAPDESALRGGEYGPYRQSERLELYGKWADTLIESKALYPCWCSAERLDGLRKEAQAKGEAFKYDRYCLTHPQSLEEPHVLRFYIPETPVEISWNDAVRGTMSFKITDLDDFVAIKSDGFPTYHFANVVDDHEMLISHVLRADEWLPSTPKHLLLFAAFGWEPPIYAHMPPVQGPGGTKKLSKRDGAQSITEYVEEGYLPEALESFMASLGWNDGTTQEVYTPDELIKKFTLDRIQKSPAMLDKERLTWMNGLMIRQLQPKELLERCNGFWPAEAAARDDAYRLSVLELVQERLKYLGELPELTDFFFNEPQFHAPLVKGYSEAEIKQHLSAISSVLPDGEWTHDKLETALRNYAEKRELKAGQLFGLIRVAITGRTAAPGLFETMLVLGREVVQKRLKNALHSL